MPSCDAQKNFQKYTYFVFCYYFVVLVLVLHLYVQLVSNDAEEQAAARREVHVHDMRLVGVVTYMPSHTLHPLRNAHDYMYGIASTGQSLSYCRCYVCVWTATGGSHPSPVTRVQGMHKVEVSYDAERDPVFGRAVSP